MQRFRITYAKYDDLCFTSNLDIHKIWERTLRRAKLPIAYSQGFHPQPKIQLASPLPLGFSSEAEIVDIYFSEEINLNNALEKLQTFSPSGLKILSMEEVSLEGPTLQKLVRSSVYEILVGEISTPQLLSTKINELTQKDQIIRSRRGKTYDLRPLIEEISLITTGELVKLELKLSAKDGATGRPEEVLSELGIDPFSTRIHRQKIIIEQDFQRN